MLCTCVSVCSGKDKVVKSKEYCPGRQAPYDPGGVGRTTLIPDVRCKKCCDFPSSPGTLDQQVLIRDELVPGF